MKTMVSSRGRIALPSELQKMDGIEPGQVFDMERVDRGDYRLIRRAASAESTLAWLLACPEKGYFVPLGSGSTDGP
jgi:bifunctional DNA-binding transcriptional regulator/antitoxin component of YhaV-PrlF toxin-antitoxin module